MKNSNKYAVVTILGGILGAVLISLVYTALANGGPLWSPTSSDEYWETSGAGCMNEGHMGGHMHNHMNNNYNNEMGNHSEYSYQEMYEHCVQMMQECLEHTNEGH